MSMTLEEAIRHEMNIAEKQEELAKVCVAKRAKDDCLKCAVEHRQLAEWLKELAERRKLPEVVRCKDCKHKGTKNCVANTWTTIFGFGVKDDFYCGLAERVSNE